MATVTITPVGDQPEATVVREIAEGHPLHDGSAGPVIETYRLPDNRAGRILVRTNRSQPERRALIHLARAGEIDDDFYLVAEPHSLEATIAMHSDMQIEKLADAAACALNPLDEECEACQ